MAARPLEAHVRRRGEFAVIELHGDIDAGGEQKLNEAYAAASSANSSGLLLNFADVAYINSTGIALIVGLLARARKEHRNVTACGLSEHYREIFQITRLADFMRLVPDEESALTEVPTSKR